MGNRRRRENVRGGNADVFDTTEQQADVNCKTAHSPRQPAAANDSEVTDASDVLRRVARRYREIAAMPDMRSGAVAMGMVLHPFRFERDARRWPDGRFHLVDRKFRRWCEADIACTRDDLIALGVVAWARSQIGAAGYLSPFVVHVVSDSIVRAPHAIHLQRLANLLDGIARWVEGQT